ILPLEQVRQQHGHTARQFALFALTHVLDFLCDVLDVQRRELASAQQRSLFVGPCHHVLLVARSHFSAPKLSHAWRHFNHSRKLTYSSVSPSACASASSASNKSATVAGGSSSGLSVARVSRAGCVAEWISFSARVLTRM